MGECELRGGGSCVRYCMSWWVDNVFSLVHELGLRYRFHCSACLFRLMCTLTLVCFFVGD